MLSETYKAVYNSYPDGVLLVDHAGAVVQANQRAEKMFGFDEAELLGKQVESLIPADYAERHKKNREEHQKNSKERMMMGDRVLKALRKDGSVFFAEISLSPLDIGNEKLTAAFVRDVTIRESLESRFHKMIGDVQDYAILFLDSEGKVTNWNKGVERIIGYSEDDIILNNFRVLYSEYDQEKNIPQTDLDTALECGRAENEGWRIKKDGSLFWASAIITAIKDEPGNVIGFSLVIRDLTERKKSEEVLRKHSEALLAKNKELESFAYIASHDLQEPLSTIKGMIELIRHENQMPLGEETESYFSFIEEAIERMNTLIRGLLDYSKLGRNKELKKVKVAETIREVLADLNTRIQAEEASFIVGPMPELTVYSVEFRLLFQNLISNALKFSRPGIPPQIVIISKNEGPHWRFSVQDNGIGIHKSHQEKIFTIFQRLHKPTQYPGTGIGLAHCKKIVEMHEGSIWVESDSDEGSTFHFTISKTLKRAAAPAGVEV